MYTLCAAGTTCEVDYCSGCTAVCRKPDNSSDGMPPQPIKPQSNSTGLGGVHLGSRHCKDGSKPVRCLVDSCSTKKCSNGEVCESNYCGGCNAVCKAPAPTNSTPGACADGSTPVNCLVDPCKTQKCAEGEVCESNYCGGCNAVCKAPAPTNSTPGACTDGTKPANCLADPCVAAASSCMADEVCEADYCGGCKAVCKKVPASPWVGPPSKCSDGSKPVECFLDPCEIKNCPEMCVRDYCGGCNATCKPFPLKNKYPISTNATNAANTTAAGADVCPDGLRPMACLVDPCSTAKCGSGRVCESNYCGGCNAVCKAPPTPAAANIIEVNVVNSTGAGSNGTCSDGSKPVQCLMDPCIATTCLTGTVCEADYCGGCNAVCKETAPKGDVPSGSGVCKDSSQPMKCLVNPCDTARCVAGTVCEPDYCGGCKAVCKKL